MIQDVCQHGTALTAKDRAALRHLYGLAPLPGDANNDGQVTGADLISVQQNFSNVLTPSNVPVPEPGFAALIVFGALLASWRRIG